MRPNVATAKLAQLDQLFHKKVRCELLMQNLDSLKLKNTGLENSDF